MGLGGYLAAKSDAEHYAKEREREKREVTEIPEEEMREVAEVFHQYGLTHRRKCADCRSSFANIRRSGSIS